MLQNSAKVLLRNSIRSADIHNRIVEEQFLWQRHSEGKRRDSRERSPHRRTKSFRTSPHQKTEDRNFDSKKHRDAVSRNSNSKKHHDGISPERKERRHSPENIWLRRLAECKEADANKWHHDGFKELYPDVLSKKSTLISTEFSKFALNKKRSCSSESEQKHKKKKRIRSPNSESLRRSASPSTSRDRRKKSERREKKHKKKRRRPERANDL